MKKPPPDLTPAEFDVMKALWREKSATVAEVRAALASTGGEQAYTTVMTLLGRLATKGAVKVDKDRQPFVYRPALRRNTVLRARLSRFVREVFDGEADALVLRLVEDETLSPDELRRIQRTLRGDDDKGRGR